MFVAWRDMLFAKGRFALITSVVVLITLLVGFLAGLTGGLAQQNISAIQSLNADKISLANAPNSNSEQDPTFSDSQITQAQEQAWTNADGVDSATAIGITQTRSEADGYSGAVAVFGGTSNSPSGDDQAVVSQSVADDLHLSAGDTMTIAGQEFTVKNVIGERSYAHTGVVYTSLPAWQGLQERMGNPESYATAIIIKGDPADTSAVDNKEGTVTANSLTALLSISSFRSEVSSLLTMVGMLFAISGLVIGAFFTVWTIQRKADIAVLKALGASNGRLRLDALGQALIILILGVGVGIALTAGLGALAGAALPFVITWYTTALPAAIMLILGLAGAAFALRSITTADPLTALGSAR
ncbi:ABC transporter permease [Kocuria sp.]|uniref:ABC transporter permease n=1 Tax=Kocuria sp. TaxID=1871328 RepID=UPI0026DFCD89|nr:ABC transporter permease [Kocuria sp.]MDO5617880.1 ABC transporter permease [Kocuria sp.]